ncbi:hypothetical protein RGR602_PB00171 (plasmid) [Rhizobium gallicum bv. gallicum R602sp]|uniref:Uncharacterized protein n=2 Tax=Rhizobium TaxID=379 RepID=A0A0B4X6J9_9HYPH|nr:hypothetical protein RGR602_PB00171 [Rhizobium gallicum bv. gallicum R602sp]MBB4276536.1 hypothetical protein [Rhizobium mongolense]TDW34191.1 hypothetical protein EV128_104198 [Rhizobium azibense]
MIDESEPERKLKVRFVHAIEPTLVLRWYGVHLLEWRGRPARLIIDAFDREIIAWAAVANTGDADVHLEFRSSAAALMLTPSFT